jgi:hypothetical protein
MCVLFFKQNLRQIFLSFAIFPFHLRASAFVVVCFEVTGSCIRNHTTFPIVSDDNWDMYNVQDSDFMWKCLRRSEANFSPKIIRHSCWITTSREIWSSFWSYTALIQLAVLLNFYSGKNCNKWQWWLLLKSCKKKSNFRGTFMFLYVPCGMSK